MIAFIISKLIGFLGFMGEIKISPKIILTILLILGVLGGLFWFRHKIIASEQFKCISGQQALENEALKKQNLENGQYISFLLNSQKKNDNFIQRQRKALIDAKEQDGAVSDLLRGTFDRMRRDRANNP